MPMYKTEESFTRMLAVAYLVSLGKSNPEIREQLGMPAYRVSQYKKEAEELGFLLEPTPPSLSAKWTGEHQRRALDATGHGGLKHLLDEADRRGMVKAPSFIEVIATPGIKNDDWPERLGVFGRKCAKRIRSLVGGADVVGVSWGGTLEGVVSGIETAPGEPTRDKPVKLVPICGEPLGRLPDRSSASVLARRLDEAVNGGHHHSLSLSGAPFIIPIHFSEGGVVDEVAVVRKLIACVDAHRTIFGKSRGGPLADKLSMVLTSVGPVDYPFGFGSERQIESAGLTSGELRRLAISDISGALLERPNLGAADAERLDRIRRHWTGISLDQIRACAERARSGAKRTPGVVAVALGANKARVVLECMLASRGGLLNHLVIGEDTEQELRLLVSRMLG